MILYVRSLKKGGYMNNSSRDVNKRFIGLWVDKEIKLAAQKLAKEQGVALSDLLIELLLKALKKN